MAPKPVTLRFLSDSSGLDKTLGTVGSKLDSFGKKLSTTGKTLTLGLTLPIVAFGAFAVKEFAESEKAAGQTAAAIKSTGGAANVSAGHVASLAEKIGDLAAVDDEVVQGAENILLTFTDIKNVGADKIFDKATLAVANLSARMDQDLNTSAVQVGKALNDPIKGLTSLGRIGVQFTEKQKAMIVALVESGDKMGAQKIILAELTKEFGGSAEAAGKTASPLEKMKLNMAKLAESIGGFVAPLVEKLSGFVGGLASGFQNLSPGVQDMIVKAALLVAALGPVMFIVGKVIGAISGVTKAMQFLVAHPIIALIAIAALIILNWDKVSAFFVKLWEKVKGAFVAAIDFLRKTPIGWFINVIDVIIDNWGKIAAFFKGVWDKIVAVFKAGVKVVMTALAPLIAAIKFIASSIGTIIGSGGIAGQIDTGAIIDALDFKGAARGFSGVVRKPTLFLAGEAGPETIDIVPFGRGRESAGGVTNVTNNYVTVRGVPMGAMGPAQIVKLLRRAQLLSG